MGDTRTLWLLMTLPLVALPGCEPEDRGRRQEAVLSASELANGAAKADNPGMMGAGGDGPPGSIEPGVPEEPEPGVPDDPPPSGAGGAGDASGPPPGPPPPSGPQITLKGEIRYEGYTGGGIQIDVMDGPSAGPKGAQPKVIQLERLSAPGPFTLRLSQGIGDIYVVAFNDADENGRPDREDPRGAYDGNPISIGEDDISEIVLNLAVEEVPPPPSGF